MLQSARKRGLSGWALAAICVAALVVSCSSAPAPSTTGGRGEAAVSTGGGSTGSEKPASSRSAEASSAAPDFVGAPPAATTSPPPPGALAQKEMAPPSPPASAPLPGKSFAAAPAQSGLKAGYSDDNEQFNLFVKFLDTYASVPHYDLAIQERIVLKVQDAEGKALANASVKVRDAAGKTQLASGLTYADGSFTLYPLEYGSDKAGSYAVELSWGGLKQSLAVDRQGPRTVVAKLEGKRAVVSPLPVDLLFILDTTGSMGEEIERLRSTIEIIDANLSALKPIPALRFGMVLYKDHDDEYVTKVLPFTADLAAFQRELDEVSADGGGDDPEDLQDALKDAVNSMNWNSAGIRLGFIVTDAPAHLDYGQSYTYVRAAREAKAKGVKLFSIGAGGLPIEGEYVLRQVAQYSQGKYIFLTYGESGESAGGSEGSVSHHTGSNFTSDKLEAIIIRFVKDEISKQSDKPLAYDEAYISAQAVPDESREQTLSKLFTQSLQDLNDYASIKLGPQTRCAIMPLSVVERGGPGPAGSGAAAGGADLGAQAEYFGSQLALAASRAKLFTIVERKDLQTLLHELELQLSGLADDATAAKVGKLLGAEVLVTGSLYRANDRYELFLKLVRVETSEVLAATKAKLDFNLGL